MKTVKISQFILTHSATPWWTQRTSLGLSGYPSASVQTVGKFVSCFSLQHHSEGREGSAASGQLPSSQHAFPQRQTPGQSLLQFRFIYLSPVGFLTWPRRWLPVTNRKWRPGAICRILTLLSSTGRSCSTHRGVWVSVFHTNTHMFTEWQKKHLNPVLTKNVNSTSIKKSHFK